MYYSELFIDHDFRVNLHSTIDITLSRKLITALHEAHKPDVIDNLLGIVTSISQDQPITQCASDNQMLVRYGSYLKELYLQIHATQSLSKWLPSPNPKIFNLVIVKEKGYFRRKVDDEFIYQTTPAQVDDILFKKSSIELEKIFTNTKGEQSLILIEGAPGSGKTTLSVYICQSWGRGELFQEFTVVVLVQLRDPAVQNAQAIADLFPCQDKEMPTQVARAITDVDGRGVLWILDGWDELPQSLREESFLGDIFTSQSKSPIAQSSVIITSRPELSGILSALATSRIDLLGFTRGQQRQYFTECLKGDIKSVDTLVERLNTDPAVGESFYLPLNASIIAHCYVNDGSLPTSVQGIFSSFVEHYLSRYQCEQLGKTAQQVSLKSLPRELQAPFDQLCKVAFTGIEENRLVFSLSDLAAIKDLAGFCEVGLLQVAPSISGKVYYSFIHSSVQIFLAALHISHLPASRQISMCELLFGDPRFLAVFKFYAAITKLRTSRPFLSKLPRWLSPVPASVLDLVQKVIENQHAQLASYQSKYMYLLVSLLDCVYAAQDPSLCQFIAKRLNGSLDIWNQGWLTSADCLAIGYFLSSISVTGCSNAEEFILELYQCAIGDIGTRSLMRGICRSVDPHSNKVATQLLISLSKNDIEEESASNIAQVLKNTSVVRGLDLHDNPIGDNGLRMIFDSLKNNSTLDFLDVACCQMTDTGVASLADALTVNSTLKTLHIEDNLAITESGLACLVEVVSQKVGLEILVLPNHLPVDRMIANINDVRAKTGLTAIAKK